MLIIHIKDFSDFEEKIATTEALINDLNTVLWEIEQNGGVSKQMVASVEEHLPKGISLNTFTLKPSITNLDSTVVSLEDSKDMLKKILTVVIGGLLVSLITWVIKLLMSRNTVTEKTQDSSEHIDNLQRKLDELQRKASNDVKRDLEVEEVKVERTVIEKIEDRLDGLLDDVISNHKLIDAVKHMLPEADILTKRCTDYVDITQNSLLKGLRDEPNPAEGVNRFNGINKDLLTATLVFANTVSSLGIHFTENLDTESKNASALKAFGEHIKQREQAVYKGEVKIKEFIDYSVSPKMLSRIIDDEQSEKLYGRLLSRLENLSELKVDEYAHGAIIDYFEKTMTYLKNELYGLKSFHLAVTKILAVETTITSIVKIYQAEFLKALDKVIRENHDEESAKRLKELRKKWG